MKKMKWKVSINAEKTQHQGGKTMELIKHHCFLQLKRKNVEISDEQKGQNHYQNDNNKGKRWQKFSVSFWKKG